MTSIPEAVADIITGDLRLYDALQMGIVNQKSLARKIKKEVEFATGMPATTVAIAMAIQRLAKKITTEKKLPRSYVEIFAKSRLQLRDDIHVLYLKKPPELAKLPHGFTVVVRGVESTTLLIDEDKLPELKIPKDTVFGEKGDLTVITLAAPKEITETPGVIAHILNALSTSKINVVEVTSSYNNTYLLVDKKDSIATVQAIRGLIERSKNKK